MFMRRPQVDQPASGSRIAWPLRWIANPVVSHLGSSNLPCRANSFKEVVKLGCVNRIALSCLKHTLETLALSENQREQDEVHHEDGE